MRASARKVVLEQIAKIHECRACHLCNLGKSVHFVAHSIRYQPHQYVPETAPIHNRYRREVKCDLNQKGLSLSLVKYQKIIWVAGARAPAVRLQHV